MATGLYPLEDTLNLKRNLEALLTSTDIKPDEDGKAGNLDAKVVDLLMIATTPQTVYHELNRVPVGVVVLAQSQHGSIRTVTLTEKSVVVEASANMTARLLIL